MNATVTWTHYKRDNKNFLIQLLHLGEIYFNEKLDYIAP